MKTRDWETPLHRAERYLAVRLVALERELPVAGTGPDELWQEYVKTVEAFTLVRAQLYYTSSQTGHGPAGGKTLRARS